MLVCCLSTFVSKSAQSADVLAREQNTQSTAERIIVRQQKVFHVTVDKPKFIGHPSANSDHGLRLLRISDTLKNKADCTPY